MVCLAQISFLFVCPLQLAADKEREWWKKEEKKKEKAEKNQKARNNMKANSVQGQPVMEDFRYKLYLMGHSHCTYGLLIN